jgi:sporulation protein YlmC with PRC-barrel domain
VVLNPRTDQVTHVVVQEKGFLGVERLVPVDLITESSPNLIRLRCTREEFAKLDTFMETEFIQADLPAAAGAYLWWPHVFPEDQMIPVEHERIPPGELAVHRGAQVHARDGHVGRVDEFLVDPRDGHITHLVLREGHLWGQKDITIPVSQIERIEEDAVYLKLDRQSIEALPAIPLRRRPSM